MGSDAISPRISGGGLPRGSTCQVDTLVNVQVCINKENKENNRKIERDGDGDS